MKPLDTHSTLIRVCARLFPALIVFHLMMTAALTVFAQDLDDVSIGGRVSDENGASIVGAKVIVRHVATGIERSATVDAEGRYRLVELAPGAYTARASAAGFADAERTAVEMLAGQSARVDFTLRPAGVSVEQVVASEAGGASIDTTRTIVGGTLTRAESETLPLNSRSPLDLIHTLGGVTEEPLSTRDVAEDRNRTPARTPEEAGTFALSGGAAYSNNITIDGLDNNDDRAARERFQPPIEAIEEVQVVTNQFSAEYGRASGGRVNLRTRGGANAFRGRAFYFFRDESLNANTWANNARGLKRLPLQEHNYGFTLGGALRPLAQMFGARRQIPARDDGRNASPESGKDGVSRPRHFFFVADELQVVLDSTVIDTLVPVAANLRFRLPAPTTLAGRRTETAPADAAYQPAELAPFIAEVNTPLRASNLTARTDHNFTDAHNATFLYARGRSRNLRGFGGGSRLADALQGRTRHSDALSYTDNFVVSPRLVNQLRAQVSRLTPALGTVGDRSRPVVLITIDDPLATAGTLNRSGTLVTGASGIGASDRRETRVQVQDTFTILSGAHTLKLGGDAQRIRSTFVDLSDASGTFDFTSAGEFLANSPARFRQRFNNESVQKNFYAGLFAQLEWQARPGLTITYGLRYEYETILDDRDNFAPRAAVAYDPFRSGKTVIRAGAGLFYNRVLLRTIDDFTLGARRVFFDTNALRNPATGKLMTNAEQRAFIAANLNFPSALAIDSSVVKQFGTLQANFTRRLDPNLRIPESYQMNLGFERELARGFVVEANYTFNRGIHLWREFNANAPRLPQGYEDFAAYLLSRDFANFRAADGTRPLYNTGSAGELVRFTLLSRAAPNPDAITRVIEFGVPVTVFNLNTYSSGSALEAALGALNDLRPDPTRGQIEQLASIGNSFYHGLIIEARRRFAAREGGFNLSMRAAYTLSRLIDDGVVNTSSALVSGDFRRERAPGLLDRRHRFVLSGTLSAPRKLGGLRFATILRVATGAPFNVSLGGADRNLDDVSNDRPVFDGDPRLIRSRRPGEALNPALAAAFSLPAIGRTGNLPRNVGRGPALFTFDINITRQLRLSERLRLRPNIEIDNLLNKTVYTFGAEFINFNSLRPTATAQQRQAFLNSFLVPTHTLRPRSIRVGLRLDF
ncbi:MAG TPA: carboxypeptidase regulatory-like domain-containing protein [Pyrinomonadaceae bacterium]|nr:carboxypeptidase regulatory-like domain-containing protein [Pyrinomonadaceae bacterium]